MKVAFAEKVPGSIQIILSEGVITTLFGPSSSKSPCELVCPAIDGARHPNTHTLCCAFAGACGCCCVGQSHRIGRKEGRKEGRNKVVLFKLSQEDFAIGVRDETSSLVREKS